MSNDDFFKQYQSKEWYELSRRIKARDHNTCQMCGRNDKPLNVHHLYYPKDGDIIDVPDNALITLCEDCHREQHLARERIKNEIENLKTKGYTDFHFLVALEYKVFGKLDKCSIDKINNLEKWRKSFNEDETKE